MKLKTSSKRGGVVRVIDCIRESIPTLIRVRISWRIQVVIVVDSSDLYPLIQFIHVLAASTWVGSHIILVTGPLIKSIRSRDLTPVLEFYKAFAWPATIGLLVAALTGAYMAYLRAPPSTWFDFGTPQGRIGEKITLFIVLLLISGYAHARIVPGMKSNNPRVYRVAIAYILIATLLTLGFPILGAMIRYGF